MASNQAVAAFRPDPADFVRYIIDHPYVLLSMAKMWSMAAALIYTASHAALLRPPSAAAAKHRTKPVDDVPPPTHLQLADALMMPVMGSVALGLLFLLLNNLQNPELVSIFLRGQVIVLVIVSGSSLYSALFRLATSLVFPDVWASRDGRHVFRIDAGKRQQDRADTASPPNPSANATCAWTADPSRTTPFPDALARFVPPQLVPAAWALRAQLRRRWTVRLLTWPALLCPSGCTPRQREQRMQLSAARIAGLCCTVAISALYLLCSNPARPGVLSNLLAVSACYMGLPEFSGTSFLICSLLMAGMFAYDVVMVFYTPLMATVAGTINAPMMLTVHAGRRLSSLGLGDVLVPGMLVCLCLRYDLYRHYARKTQTVATALETETAAVVDGARVTRVSTAAATRRVKAPYVSPHGRWGDWAWTWPAAAWARQMVPGLAAASFAKPFFHVSLASYVVGLALANIAVEYTHRGQPALFYIVPVMLLATWGQAAATGNLQDMWSYTESGAMDTVDVVVDVAAAGVASSAASTAVAIPEAEAAAPSKPRNETLPGEELAETVNTRMMRRRERPTKKRA